jgi:transposase InsO family protein
MIRYYSRPGRPTDYPEVERFNRTLQREWLDAGNHTLDVGQLQRHPSTPQPRTADTDCRG